MGHPSVHKTKLYFKKCCMGTRLSVKIKNIFLSPGDFTPSAFMYEESKTPIARL